MRKSWLALIIGLSVFALMGADCDTGGNADVDKGPLPPRALAATPLLRTYYQTQYIPKGMKPIKIPEGDAFDPDELTLNFDMGGDERVQEVRVRVTVGKPNLLSGQSPDLFARVIAPDGTTSSWQEINLILGTSAYDPHPEVAFLTEFDDIFSTGVWKLQLRDPIKDNDGRLLFRNATLRINGGEVSSLTGQPVGSEMVTLTPTTGKFGAIPELAATGFLEDFGIFGVENALINQFTFSESFSVRDLTLFCNIESLAAEDIDGLRCLIIAPSGGYHFYGLAVVELDDYVTSADTVSGTLQFVFTGSDPAFYVSQGHPFQGEPSLGTWWVCLYDGNVNHNSPFLASDTSLFDLLHDPGPGPIFIPPPNFPSMQLSLTGILYP